MNSINSEVSAEASNLRCASFKRIGVLEKISRRSGMNAERL